MRWIMLAAAAGLLWTGAAAAEKVPVYPGAKIYSDRMIERPRIGSRDVVSEWHPVTHQRIYTTPATFEKVYTFYKMRFEETDRKLKKTGKDAKTGIELNTAYFCLDGESTIADSGLYVKIQHPLLKGRRQQGFVVKPRRIEDLTAITVVRKWRAGSAPAEAIAGGDEDDRKPAEEGKR